MLETVVFTPASVGACESVDCNGGEPLVGVLVSESVGVSVTLSEDISPVGATVGKYVGVKVTFKAIVLLLGE